MNRQMRILGCVLAMALTLLVGGCSQMSLSTPVNPSPVPIDNNCKVPADRDEVQVSIDGNLHWNPPSPVDGYKINFSMKTPFGAGVRTVDTGKDLTVKGDDECTKLTVYIYKYIHQERCYFPYKVSRTAGTPCPDPGVRVVPPNFAYLILVLPLIGIGGGAVAWWIKPWKRG